MLQKTNYPCWLNKNELLFGNCLLELGFSFCGDCEIEDELILCGNFDNSTPNHYFLTKINGWRFYSAVGYIGLEAIYKNALYTSPQGIDIKKTLSQIRKQFSRIKLQIAQNQPQQLSLFHESK